MQTLVGQLWWLIAADMMIYCHGMITMMVVDVHAQIVWLNMFRQLGRYKTDHLFTDTEGTIEASTLSMIESNYTCMV